MAVVHCGQFPKFMSQTAYNSLLKDDIPISVMDIPDSVQRTKVQQLLEATSCDAIQEMMHENYVLFELAGCYKPATTFSESSRNKLVDDVVRFIVIGRNLPPIQQLRQGLQTFGLLDLMKDHSTQFNAGFLPGQTTNLTAEQVEAVFSKIEYSEIWSNKRREEECTIAYWRDYLIDIEERNVGVTFEDVLVFATGGNKVLYLGFSPDPSVEFVYDSGEKNFPLANTCSMVLRLPTVNSYEQFKNMDFGILNL
ncbi:G2/M phase-specific E3 ubiquitin-protein ligase-like [Mercenaria mercenaria]|uniref:G2/M phase-specific E3 ubiquitin-protein ligase-like n=1 Tax=Mercenaria mercenaria TaxID=6596 RepID=UPI00234F515E|nr:G2/M phase-specific E3 ubiquitin-protein ligase-like [Mercenaria mercenaria]